MFHEGMKSGRNRDEMSYAVVMNLCGLGTKQNEKEAFILYKEE